MCVYCIAILKTLYIYIWFIINAQKRLPSRPIHNSSPPQRLQAQAEEYSPQAAQVGSLGKEASTFQILSHQNHQRQNWSLCKKTEVGGEAILQVLCTDGMCSPDQFSIGWSKTSLEKKELNHVKPDLTTASSMSPKRSSSGGSSGRSSEDASISYQVKVWKQVVETMLSNAWGGKLLCGCLTPPTTPTSNYK